MHETAIQELDRAAVTLLKALEANAAELAPYLESERLQALYADVIGLRRALLGLQMGPLYWETPAEWVDDVLKDGELPVSDAAARVAAKLRQPPQA